MLNPACLPCSTRGVTLRHACLEDIRAVSELLGGLGYSCRVEEVLPIFRVMLQSSNCDIVAACLERSEVVGLMTLARFPALHLMGWQVSIEELVVHPDHRGKGIGRDLLRYAVAYTDAVGATLLEVLTNRKRESFERRFYEKNGFIPSNHSVFRVAMNGLSRH